MRINVTNMILPFCIKKMGRRRTPTLKKKLSFKFCHQNSVIEAAVLILQIVNIIIKIDGIRQEKPNKGSTLKLNKIFK